jgi:hypothetical protein
MRQLSSTLVEWQEEVIRVQSVYQNKVEKAKEVITKVIWTVLLSYYLYFFRLKSILPDQFSLYFTLGML